MLNTASAFLGTRRGPVLGFISRVRVRVRVRVRLGTRRGACFTQNVANLVSYAAW